MGPLWNLWIKVLAYIQNGTNSSLKYGILQVNVHRSCIFPDLPRPQYISICMNQFKLSSKPLKLFSRPKFIKFLIDRPAGHTQEYWNGLILGVVPSTYRNTVDNFFVWMLSQKFRKTTTKNRHQNPFYRAVSLFAYLRVVFFFNFTYFELSSFFNCGCLQEQANTMAPFFSQGYPSVSCLYREPQPK